MEVSPFCHTCDSIYTAGYVRVECAGFLHAKNRFVRSKYLHSIPCKAIKPAGVVVGTGMGSSQQGGLFLAKSFPNGMMIVMPRKSRFLFTTSHFKNM